MARNFIQPGKVLTVVATGVVASGSFQAVGAIFGVATTSAKAGEEYELATGGVYELAKTPGTAWAMGDVLYFDAATKSFTKTAGSNTKVGVAAQSATSASGLGMVRLNDNF